MSNVKLGSYTNTFTGETIEYVIIDNGNGEYTSMTKAHYDELQAQTNKIGVVTNGDN